MRYPIATSLLVFFSLCSQAFEKEGQLPDKWINGQNCADEPVVQVHEFNQDFYILRQSLCTHFEGPFIYLIFGENRVLMQDTGASDVGLVKVVNDIINSWLKKRSKHSIQLIVSHSHGHSDHIFADGNFKKRPNTRVIDPQLADVANFFSIRNWPDTPASYDLGNRIIDVIAIPGHESSHIALYDRLTRILLTGDSFYPGRLYFKQKTFSQYKNSVKRLVDWVSERPVTHVLGTHIEMTSVAGKDYGFEVVPHLNERKLELSKSHLVLLNESLQGMTLPVKKTVLDDSILFPLD